MKVVFQHQGLINDRYKQFFQDNTPDGVELVFSQHSDPDKLAEDIADAKILVGYRLSQTLLQEAKSLKHLQIPWTGFNNLGKEFLNDREITVSNSHSNSLAIAEHAVALLTSAAKLIPFRHNKMKIGDWSPRRRDINSYWISDKTVGILGYGAIGKKVAKMMHYGFNCDILAIKRDKSKFTEEDKSMLSFYGDNSDLEKLLKESDFLVVAVPLTSETEGIIGKKEFQRMKETAIIVNIARGPVINEEALFEALDEEVIGAAGIDTWYNYPSGGEDKEVFQNYPFHELENIVMSPHSAFKVRDRVEVFSQHILENINRIFEGKEPINRVNLELGY